MPSKQHYEIWRCFICGKMGRGTWGRLTERGWACFTVYSKGNLDPVKYEFGYHVFVQLCPEHDMESDQVASAFFFKRSWKVFRQTGDDSLTMLNRAIRDEMKCDHERRHPPQGYI